MRQINNVFTIGYRCNADELLEALNIRKYSSPFSFMVIDVKTALKFISTNFENYTNPEFIEPGNNTNLIYNRIWWFTNKHKCSVITDDYANITDMETVCIWNHHNVTDPIIASKLNRRSRHLLDCLSKSPDTLLLLHIALIQKYEEGKCYFDKSILDGFDCNFLIIVPLEGFNKDPVIAYEDSKIRIIYFNNSDMAYPHNNVDDWNKLKILINTLYSFKIEARIIDGLRQDDEIDNGTIPARKKFIWNT
jgi:hypothetical protein